MATTTYPSEDARPAAAVDRGCCGPAVVAPALGEAEARAAAARFKVLGDPTRLRILALLAASEEPVCACDCACGIPLEQPTISHHLKVLRDAGLVESERRGTWAYYRIRPDAEGWVHGIVKGLER